jgi:hypothetical protein
MTKAERRRIFYARAWPISGRNMVRTQPLVPIMIAVNCDPPAPMSAAEAQPSANGLSTNVAA